MIDFKNDKLIMPPAEDKDGWGGPPTVADFDGDGRPDIATASAVSSVTRSALICAPAIIPAAAAAMTVAKGAATFPATQTPGIAVAPFGSAGTKLAMICPSTTRSSV